MDRARELLVKHLFTGKYTFIKEPFVSVYGFGMTRASFDVKIKK